MFNQFQSLVFAQTNITGNESHILLYLACRANEQGECWPSIKRITKECHRDRKTVLNVIKSLIKKKLIIKTGEMKGKTKRVPVYKLILNSPKNGTSFFIETVPFLEGNGTVFALKNSPKNGTLNKHIEYTKECGKNYQEYVSKLKAEIKLKLKPEDYKILSFEEWKKT